MILADPRLEALQRYAHNLASADDLVALEEAITHDAEFRRFFVEYLHLDASLEEHAAEWMPVRLVQRPRQKLWLLAAAAVVLISTMLWWMLPTHDGVDVVVIESSDSHWKPGTQTHLRALSLAGGSLKLRIESSGVLIDAEGPLEMRLLDPMHVNVLHGKLTADVGEHGKGFVLDTPQARVVDLGTRFGVDATKDGHTDVVVLQGTVKLADGTSPMRLEQGQAVRVNETRQWHRITSVTGGVGANEWSTKPAANDRCITSATDNFTRMENMFFYRIVPRGMAPGAPIYAFRSMVFEPADGKAFPTALLGADLVQTFRGARKHGSFEMQVMVQKPSMLYVLMPEFGTPAAWLPETFTRTGEEVTVRDAAAHANAKLPFEVWQREVRTPGTITLGAANRSDGDPTTMYAVAAKPL